jgi:hypothetical protein
MASNLIVNGNVGIGTSAPGQLLSIVGAGSYGTVYLRGTANETAIMFNDPANSAPVAGYTGWFVGQTTNWNTASNTFGIARLSGGGALANNGLFITSNGSVGIGAPTPAAKLDIQGGHGNTGLGGSNLMAFQFFNGGYRHFITTRHVGSANNTQNAIDFWLNTSATAVGSSTAGTGNVNMMSVTATGVGINCNMPGFGYGLDVNAATRMNSVSFDRFAVYNDLVNGAPSYGIGQVTSGLAGLGPYSNLAAFPPLQIANYHGINFVGGQANWGAGASHMCIVDAKVGIATTAPAAKLDILGGHNLNEAGGTNLIAFQGYTGGFRHFITSRHNSSVGATTNSIDFWLNNTTTAGGSSTAGTGNVRMLSVSETGVGIGGNAAAGVGLYVNGSGFFTAYAGIGVQSANSGFRLLGDGNGFSYITTNAYINTARTAWIPDNSGFGGTNYSYIISMGAPYSDAGITFQSAAYPQNSTTITTFKQIFRVDVNGNTFINGNILYFGGTGNNTQTSNLIRFSGTVNDGVGSYSHTVIGENIYSGSEACELLLFKGGDADATFGPERVRVLSVGGFQVDILPGGTTWADGAAAPAAAISGALCVVPSGNVGINTTNPQYKLDVRGASFFSSNVILAGGQFNFFNSNVTGGTAGSYGSFYHNTGNSAGYMVADYSFLGDVWNLSYNAFANNGAWVVPNGGLGGTSRIQLYGGGIAFYSGSGLTAGKKPTFNIMEFFYDGNATMPGNLREGSDIRLKENIVNLDSCLDKVKALRGVYYNRKDLPGIRQIGFIAQEVEPILPELVATGNTEEKMKSIAYQNIVPVLVEAIKEQQVMIESQQSTIIGILARLP